MFGSFKSMVLTRRCFQMQQVFQLEQGSQLDKCSSKFSPAFWTHLSASVFFSYFYWKKPAVKNFSVNSEKLSFGSTEFFTRRSFCRRKSSLCNEISVVRKMLSENSVICRNTGRRSQHYHLRRFILWRKTANSVDYCWNAAPFPYSVFSVTKTAL